MAAIQDYPTLESHAQIQGTVIGAGDITVKQGRITLLSNQSGSWQPGGTHLAKTIRLLVKLKILNPAELVADHVTVQQYLHRPEGLDVDNGRLVTLLGTTMRTLAPNPAPQPTPHPIEPDDPPLDLHDWQDDVFGYLHDDPEPPPQRTPTPPREKPDPNS